MKKIILLVSLLLTSLSFSQIIEQGTTVKIKGTNAGTTNATILGFEPDGTIVDLQSTLNDISADYTLTSISGNIFTLQKDGVNVIGSEIDLGPYLDNVEITSGTLDPLTGILTATKSDASTIAIDLSPLVNAPPITALSELTDDIGATEGVLPLSAFLDITNGNDTTARLEQSARPFQTIEALMSALPPTTGETYSIYITGGTIPIVRKIPSRNFSFFAYNDVELDFTNVKEDDGTTDATSALIGFGAKWIFNGNNISIKCDFNGRRDFPQTLITGIIKNFRWSSQGFSASKAGFDVAPSSDFTIINFISPIYSVTGIDLLGTSLTKLRVINYLVDQPRIAFSVGSFDHEILLENITQTSTGALGVLRLTSNATPRVILTIKNINYNGSVQPYAKKLIFDGVIQDNSNISFGGTKEITGRIISNVYLGNGYTAGTLFNNFTGKLGYVSFISGNGVIFQDSSIEVNGNFLRKTSNISDVLPTAIFRGYNLLTQNDLSQDTFIVSNPANGNFRLQIEGTLVSNVDSYGRNVQVENIFSTFKEKLGEITVRNSKDLANRTLDPELTYIIDGDIQLAANEYIWVPELGNLTINGYGLEASRIIKNVAGQAIFMSNEVNGSAGLQVSGLSFTTTGSVFDLRDATGNNAIEVNVVNFDGCNSLGEIDGYRQFLGTTIGIYGVNDGFTLSGAMNGFKITNTNIFGFGSEGTLFNAGTNLVFSNRFYAELNADLPTGAILADFASTNFSSNELFQITNSLIKYNGVIDDSSTSVLLANTNANDPTSRWVNNIGIINTAISQDDTGWAQYTDTQYTAASPFSVVANTSTNLPNNAGNTLEIQKPRDVSSFYDAATQKILGRNGDGLAWSIEMKVTASVAAADYVKLSIDIGGTVGEIYPYFQTLPLGTGEAMTLVYPIPAAYTLGTWEANGGQVKIFSDGAITVHDIRYVFTRTHKAR